MNKETTYGGNGSVRYDEEGRMLIKWGHEEAIIKQFTLTTKGWVGPNGETAIVPKDDGAGLMLSAFQCREFGFGLQMSEQDHALVNEYRKDKNYIDKDAAKEKCRDAKKKHLLKAPLYLNSNTGRVGRGTGCMSIWFSSLKTAWIASRCYILSTTSFSCWITPVGMTGRE
jgi:hypothetical protein